LSPQETVPIRFRPQWRHQAQFAGVYIAAEKGFYRNYGLDVEIQSGGPDFPAYEALVSGQSDIVTLFLSTALNRYSQETPLVNLAQISQRSAIMLVGKRSPSLNRIEQLNGKKIGLWRNDFREPSLIFFQEKGLNVEPVPIDWSVNLLLNNAIDMMNVMLYNEYHQVLMAGLDKEELFEIRLSDEGYNIVEDGIYTTEEFYQKNPEACRQFAEATIDGWIYALNHPEETLEVVIRRMRQDHIAANRPHQAWMLDKMKELILADPDNIGVLSKKDFDFAQTLMYKHDLLRQKIDYRAFCPNAK
jgi:NitT/TauT family transport system substrate-binding protein